jgi:primosomal protein N' (replication factor Y)
VSDAIRFIGVAVPVPALGLLTYRAPAGEPLPKGARVQVPLRGRRVVGVVVEPDAHPPEGRDVRDITSAIDREAFVPPDVVDLAMWMGEYYMSGPGAALALAMPPAARTGTSDSFKTRRVIEATGESPAAEAAGARPLTPKQRAALTEIETHAGGMDAADLVRRGFSRAIVDGLAKRGLIRVRDAVVLRDPFAGYGWEHRGVPHADAQPAMHELSAEQADALRRLEDAAAARMFRAVLLHGVTASGKTELYLRLGRRVVESGRRVLMLVPEIALTPALVGLVRDRFGGRVAVQHSGLSAGERHDQWHLVRRGDVDVVVGTRGAVLAPIDRLGLIVVDEEHDGSYKQDEAPRYHARDVAVVRARAHDALVILGSATPSLESASNARAGRYDLVRLRERVKGRAMARVRVVNMREEYAARGPDVVLSRPLVEAIGQRLGRGEQSIILLNRRGFATVVFCRGCGASLECPHCSVSLTFHRAQRRVRCHYCNYALAAPSRCGSCGGEFLEQAGFGTERVEAELRAHFPGARVARLDRDTMRRRGAIARLLDAVSRGEVDAIVGTQMIAKGHDFPSVTLVGVVSADVGLGLPDFRAAERTFQLLTQVAGRAGRGESPGEALVQTLYPDHYAVQTAAAQDYDTFFEREMEFREALRYPPAVAMINVIVKSRDIDVALSDAHDLVKRTRHRHPHGQVIGPAPAALAKVRDEYRAQFFMKGAQRRPMRQALRVALDERPDLRSRVIVDVDPQSTL